MLLVLAGCSQETPEVIERYKPVVPEPLAVQKRPHPLRAHPWLQLQPNLHEISIEVEKDLAHLEHFCAVQDVVSQEKLIDTLLALQEQVPFSFPDHFYNVLCIPEPIVSTPEPYKIFQRLYVGEKSVGMPLYLDVRVFDLELMSSHELITWHRETLVGEVETLYENDKRQTYLITGVYNPARPDPTHGFGSQTRTLFLDCIEQEGRLFIAYLDIPESFE